jgi:hypothetical protein
MAAAMAMTMLAKHKDKIAGAAGLGAIVLLGGRLIRSAPKEDFPELEEDQNALLQAHSDFYGCMVQLRRYGMLEHSFWAPLLANVLLLLAATHKLGRLPPGSPGRLAVPREAARATDVVILNVRRMRAMVHATHAHMDTVMSDFDEAAAALNEACKNTNFNLMLSCAS